MGALVKLAKYISGMAATMNNSDSIRISKMQAWVFMGSATPYSCTYS